MTTTGSGAASGATAGTGGGAANGTGPKVDPKAPETPEITEIIELVDVTRMGLVVAALLVGIAAGVAVYWLATHVLIEQDSSDA